MSEARFTKGPWEVKPIEDDKEYIRIRGTVLGGRFKVCNVIDAKYHHESWSEWREIERNESTANANLIAAATEMYEMLVELRSITNKYGVIYARDSIDLLLAKARGESV